MSDDGIRWVRVSRGLYLLGFGTFLLLTTQDLLPATFWGDVVPYWPVLLVALGIRLVFERSPFPSLVLLGPALVLGTMMAVAMRGPAAADAGGDWTEFSIARPAGAGHREAWTFEGRVALAALDIESRRLPRDLLVEGRATDTGRRTVRVEEPAPGRVRVTNTWSKGTIFVVPGRSRSRCELGIAPGLPVTFDLGLAFTETRLDVAAAPVERVSFEGAFNNLTLRLGEPASSVRLDLEGAFNQIVVEIPAGARIRVSSDGFLNVVDKGRAEAAGAAGGGAAGAGGADSEYNLHIEGAFNRVVVRQA